MITQQDLELGRAIARHRYGAEIPVEPLAASNNALLRLRAPGGDKVLKLAGPGGGDAVRKELMLIGLLAKHEIPVPRVEWDDAEGAICGRPFFVMESAGDRTVMDWSPEPGQLPQMLFTEMGSTLARIHRIRFPGAGDIRHDGLIASDPTQFVGELHAYAAQLADEGILETAEVRRFESLQMPSSAGDQLCHSDFHAPQCVVHEGRITAVVDWEAAWSGNATIDLAFTHAYLDFYCASQRGDGVARAIELQRCFFDGYRAIQPLPPDYATAYLPVRMAHALGVLRAWHRWGPVAWQNLKQRGRVARVVDLYRAYEHKVGESPR